MKKYIKLFIIIFTFIVLGVGIPLSLKSFNGVGVITQEKKEQDFLQEAIKEADRDFDKLENFTVLRLKAVSVLKDIPDCDGNIYRYIGFVKAYSFFNIPYVRHVIVYSKNGEKISGSIIETSKKFKTIQDESGIGICF